jgi:dTMP kinase
MDGREAGSAPDAGTVLRGATPSAYLGLLRNRGFRNLTLATLTSAVGDWMGFFAIITLTADILGPGNAALFAVSGVMAARVVPALLLGTVAGVLVDRWDRKRVLIATDLGRGLVMALIPFTNEVFTLILATLVIEMLSSLFAPAKDAVFPSLVKRSELVLANQINLISTYGTLPVGALLNAALTALAVSLAPEGSFLAERPIALPIWVNAASYWVSAPLLARLVIPPSARYGRSAASVDSIDESSPWDQLKEGFRFIARQPVIRSLIIGVMVAFAAAGVVISVGEFFARLLNSGPSGFGILVGLVGVGLIVGLALTGPLSHRLRPERLFAPGIGLAGVMLLVIAVVPTLGWAAVPAFLMGLGAGVSFIVGYTVLQQRAGDEIRGRTFAAFNSGVRVALFGATVAVPLLVGAIGRERPVVGELPDGSFGVEYPYAFGGIRISLLIAGMLALTGAVWTGRALHKALVEEPGLDGLASGAGEPVTRRGVFVVFEGGDGSGKSTQIRLLRSAIERAGWDVVITREPGGTRIGEGIREVLLSPDSSEMSDRAEALLYAAARAQHVDEVIRPAVEAGQVVLCDRYVDSSIVYQGTARGLGERAVSDLNAWATGELRPDVTVLLDVDAEEGLRRASGGEGPDRLEAAGLDFHRTVAEAYRRRAELEPDRYLVLDASDSVEHLHHVLRDAVLTQLADHRSDLEVADAAAAAERDAHRAETDVDGAAGGDEVSHRDGTLELPAETAALPRDGEGRR